MSWTRERLAMAAAHLCDLAGIALRGGRVEDGTVALNVASMLQDSMRPEDDYREGLAWARGRLVSDDADYAELAVDSILRGEHPADSLPGRIDGMRQDAKRSAFDRREVVFALGTVLEMLGCEVPR